MSTVFKTLQQVVYPTHGVGKIIEIEEREFHGKQILYYIIYIEVSDMTIMIPVDKAEERGIRPIIQKKEALAILKFMEGESESVPSDWKMRYEMNRQHFLKGDTKDVAQIVQTLYHRSKVKELPILERKLYDSAVKLLINELSISLEKPQDEIGDLVFEHLEIGKEVNEVQNKSKEPLMDEFDVGVDEDGMETNKNG